MSLTVEDIMPDISAAPSVEVLRTKAILQTWAYMRHLYFPAVQILTLVYNCIELLLRNVRDNSRGSLFISNNIERFTARNIRVMIHVNTGTETVIHYETILGLMYNLYRHAYAQAIIDQGWFPVSGDSTVVIDEPIAVKAESAAPFTVPILGDDVKSSDFMMTSSTPQPLCPFSHAHTNFEPVIQKRLRVTKARDLLKFSYFDCLPILCLWRNRIKRVVDLARETPEVLIAEMIHTQSIGDVPFHSSSTADCGKMLIHVLHAATCMPCVVSYAKRQVLGNTLTAWLAVLLIRTLNKAEKDFYTIRANASMYS